MIKEENPYNPITEPASYKWFNEKPKSEKVQLQSENVQLKAEREWISVEDLKEAFYEGQDGRYTEFDNWYFEYRKPLTP